MTTRKPIIGITLDSEEPGGYSKFPWYALRENYAGAVTEAGGIPMPLPHEVELVPDLLDLIDGLVVTGGTAESARTGRRQQPRALAPFGRGGAARGTGRAAGRARAAARGRP